VAEWARADFDQRHKFNVLGSFAVRKWTNLGVALTLASGAPYTMTTGLDPYHTGMANARPPSVPRNSLQGPGYADLDLRWSRDFNLSKSKKEKGSVATVGFDAFNVMNTSTSRPSSATWVRPSLEEPSRRCPRAACS
jgi:hypothetical protein